MIPRLLSVGGLMTTKRAEDLCEGDVILMEGRSLPIKSVTHPFHDTVRVDIELRSGGIATFHAAVSREFVIVEHQLWTALYTHEFGNDSYLFLVESKGEVTIPLDEVKVAHLLGLEFDIDTEIVHSARLINFTVANPTDMSDHKGRPLPIYKD